MSAKVKGLIRGLRYITHIFDEKEKKEEEIQIGFPTDVKHVAHIGLDGPSAAAPTWMNEFKNGSSGSQPAPAEAPVNSVKTRGDSKTSKDSKHRPRLIPKSRHGSLESNTTDSPSSDGSKKHVRRHRLSDPPTSEFSPRDSPSSSGSSRHSRKSRSSNLGSDSPAKHRLRRKKKTGSMDGSERSSTKGDSITDISLPDLDAVVENGHHQ